MTAVQHLAHFVVDVKNYRIDVTLFVDHSQIVQLERLRAGIWGTDDTWGRMLTYRGPSVGGDAL
jgi:phosphosulfolactate synthase (CoM biosynthesis protein A)